MKFTVYKLYSNELYFLKDYHSINDKDGGLS